MPIIWKPDRDFKYFIDALYGYLDNYEIYVNYYKSTRCFNKMHNLGFILILIYLGR